MKKILGLLLAVFIISSCESFEHKSEFDKSYQKWKSFKNSSKNSYRYVTTGGSWVGVSWETEIVVESGQVVERNFSYKNFESVVRPVNGWDEESSKQVLEILPHLVEYLKERNMNILDYLEWRERKIELGIHTQAAAGSLWTLDEVYAKAKDEWLVKRDDATTYFETKNNGMISSCGFVPNNCQDDCFRGVSIRSIEAI
jgi:hypothetical protein